MTSGKTSLVIATPLALGAFVVGTVLSCGSVWYLRGRLRQQIDTHGHYVVRSLARNSTYAALTDDKPLGDQLAKATCADGGDLALVAIRNRGGEILGFCGRGLSPADLLRLPSPAEQYTQQTIAHPTLGNLIVFRAPVVAADAKEGPVGVVDVAIPARGLAAHLPLVLGVALLGVLVGSLALGLVLLVPRRGAADA
jgi:hypothetical protein